MQKKIVSLFFFLAAAGFIYAQTAEGPQLRCRAAVLLDAATGAVLYSKNADMEIPPASLTKLMTIHVALQKVSLGEISLDEPVPLPRESWAVNQPPRSSLMFLGEGQLVTLRELLLGLAVSSGNDAAVAVAFYASRGIDTFVDDMNREARALGLTKTSFVEPSGISEYNMTTAMEYARFCRAYITLHPEVITQLHSVNEFAYPKLKNYPMNWKGRVGTILQYNKNLLLGTLGVDGLKTGFIEEAGYNIALTAEQNGTRFVAVLLGGPGTIGSREAERIRAEDGKALLSWGFDHYKTVSPVLDSFPEITVWKASRNKAEITPMDSLTFTARTNRGEPLHWIINIHEPVVAPLPAGSVVGDIVFYDNSGELNRVPMVIREPLEKGNIFKRIWHSIRLFFMK